CHPRSSPRAASSLHGGPHVTRSRRSIPLAVGALLALGCASAHAGGGPADFDFHLGHWKTRIHPVRHPLASRPQPNAMTGAVSARRLWDGGGLEETEADGAQGHWEGLSLFLHHPTTRQWSQSFAGSKHGALGLPGSVGEWTDGRLDLYSSDTDGGRAVLERS